MSIQILRPGLLTSVQDLGRFGYQKYGVIVSGGMDTVALRIANLLVGNPEGEAVLEITLIGPSIVFHQDALIAITGADLSPSVDGMPIPLWRPVFVKKGSMVTFGPCRWGSRAYLAVAGGFDLPEVLGSRSTYLRAGIGGYQGRGLKADDELAFGGPSELATRLMSHLEKAAIQHPFATAKWYSGRPLYPVTQSNPIIRVMRGRHYDWFKPESIQQFFSSSFEVSPQSDRMGYRLSGPSLELQEPLEILSEAVTHGAIQVPSEGNPIILLSDRQTIGGYPIIAHTATVDIPILAQVKPGEKLRFQEITQEEAENLYVQRELDFQQFKSGLSLKLYR